ncbi:hypothetical protein MPY17_16355 [Rhodococcus opacus]|nr:hypothetical protein [Rhodococcus opacus]UOT07196.1 hypothetical protein MPY17_16355 [Rhodococcus opacus]
MLSNSVVTLRCVTTTPFGRPVDPDVYTTYATASGVSPARRSGSVIGSGDRSIRQPRVSASSTSTVGRSRRKRAAWSVEETRHTGEASDIVASSRSAG